VVGNSTQRNKIIHLRCHENKLEKNIPSTPLHEDRSSLVITDPKKSKLCIFITPKLPNHTRFSALSGSKGYVHPLDDSSIHPDSTCNTVTLNTIPLPNPT